MMKSEAIEALARQERARRASSFEPERYSARRSRVSSFDEGSTVNYSNSSHQANALPAVTVPHVFRNAVNIRGQMPYLVNPDGTVLFVRDFYQLACSAAKSLLHLGLRRYQGVAILARNDRSWFISSVATIFAGGVAVGISRGSTTAIIRHILSHAKAHVLVTDDTQTILNWDGDIPVENVVLTDTSGLDAVRARLAENSTTEVHTWNEFMALGSDVTDEALAELMEEQKPEQCCTLMYTSGTTGMPKAVMLSHDNITWTIKVIGQTLRLDGTDVGLSFLPLSHIAANLIDIHGSIQLGLQMHLIDSTVSKPKGLGDALCKIEPTFLVGVPAVWERLHDALEKVLFEKSRLGQKVASMAFEIGAKSSVATEQRKKKPWNFALANRVVLRKVVKQMGLSRCKFCVNVGASLRSHTAEFFSALHIPILDVYGLTETAGPATVSTPWLFSKGSVGKPLNGVECVIRNPSASGEGEILLRGRNVFVGYLGDEEATGAAVDDDGFLHTGDLGKMSANGHVVITGRIKELVVMKDGHNIGPVAVEDVLRQAIPGVKQTMLIGDGHNALVCVVALDEEVDADGQTSGLLANQARLINPEVRTVQQAQSDPMWTRHIQTSIANARAEIKEVSGGYEICHYVIARQAFTYRGGELTALGKMRRRVIQEMYEAEVDKIHKKETAAFKLQQEISESGKRKKRQGKR